MAIDPVCGMKVDDDAPLQHSFEGVTYHFCSEHCLHKFRDQPHQYLKQAEPAAGAGSAANSYTCPMHPEVVQDPPGNGPKCGMALEAVSNVAMKMEITKPLQFGVGACALMLVIYFGVVGLISGMDIALPIAR